MTKFLSLFRAWSEDRKSKLTIFGLKKAMTSISKNTSINRCKITSIQKMKDEVQLTLLSSRVICTSRVLLPNMKASKRNFLKSAI